MIMSKIRKRGKFYFNTNATGNTDGERKVTRRSPKRETSEDVLVVWPTKPNLRFDASTNVAPKKSIVKRRSAQKQVTGRTHVKVCDILRKNVFPTLEKDDVVRGVRRQIRKG